MMIVKVYFDFFLDTKSVQGKEKILNKITRLLDTQYGCALVNHIENNKFIITYGIDTWKNLIFRLIEFSQTIGR
ncbi:unnamed protein product [Commensalibacter communis]|nr:unnamed protein product [Commensalibacter communis]CAI3932439.1 unnamed protein product [Commensalibacter communis]